MCGGKIKYILIAYFLGNIYDRTVYVKIIASCKGGTFFETQYTCYTVQWTTQFNRPHSSVRTVHNAFSSLTVYNNIIQFSAISDEDRHT